MHKITTKKVQSESSAEADTVKEKPAYDEWMPADFASDTDSTPLTSARHVFIGISPPSP